MKDIKIVLLYQQCPIVHPLFSFAYSGDVVSKTHRQALLISGSKRKIIHILYYIFWPARAIHLAYKGSHSASETNLFRTKLFFLMWTSLIRHNITVDSFMKYKLWLPENYARSKEYIQHHEIIQILPWLNSQKNIQYIDNKIHFERLCRENSISTAQIIATCGAEGVSMYEPNLPEIDLFSKFDELWCGVGAQTWIFNKGDRAWQHDNYLLSEKKLLQHLCASAKNMPILIQPKLSNHKPIDALSNGALCTFRVITFKLANQEAKHYLSALRMPTGTLEVDNFAAGGIAAGLSANGHLKSAVEKQNGYSYIDSHPDTGSTIKGKKLECWNDIVKLAIHAHNTISDVYSIGWDIAWTQQGAVVIEANMVWCAELIQMAHNEPLGYNFCKLFWDAANERN